MSRISIPTVEQSVEASKPLLAAVDLDRLPLGTVDTWVAQSEQANGSIAQARIGLDVAQLEINKAKAGHLPTLDLTASYSNHKTEVKRLARSRRTGRRQRWRR